MQNNAENWNVAENIFLLFDIRVTAASPLKNLQYSREGDGQHENVTIDKDQSESNGVNQYL